MWHCLLLLKGRLALSAACFAFPLLPALFGGIASCCLLACWHYQMLSPAFSLPTMPLFLSLPVVGERHVGTSSCLACSSLSCRSLACGITHCHSKACWYCQLPGLIFPLCLTHLPWLAKRPFSPTAMLQHDLVLKFSA